MLKALNLSKIYYPKKGSPVTALDNVSLDIADKGLVFLLGKSGSGKSTLLNLLGGLDSYTSGDIIIKGKSTKNFKQSGFDSYRNTFIGFIFQEFNILEEYSVGQNIGMALELQHKKADKNAINNILKQVDLEDYFNRKPNELSGGQKQRVAIARALVKEPEIIMADEPTGSLDSNTGKQVFDTLKKISEYKLVIVVTHDRENAELFGDRIIELADGKIISDRIRLVQTGTLVEQNFSILDDKLIKIKAGTKLEPSDFAKINEIIVNSREDAYISLDNSANVNFSNKAAKIIAGGGKIFKPTSKENLKIKDYDGANFELVKSRLPAKDSFKMGISGLKHKKVRLVFTIFLSFLTFFMSGFSATAALFDRYKSEMQTILQNGAGNVLVRGLSGQDYGMGVNYSPSEFSGFTKEQLSELEKLSGVKPLKVIGSQYSQNYNLTSNFATYRDDSYNLYYQTLYKNFAVVENEDDAGLKKIGNSRLPSTPNEIAISDYTAESFIKYGYKDPKGTKIEISNYEDMIGKTIKLDHYVFKITGVYKTEINLEVFEKYKDSNGQGLMGMSFNPSFLLMGMCYVSKDFTFEKNSTASDYYYFNEGSLQFSSKEDVNSFYDKRLTRIPKQGFQDSDLCLSDNADFNGDKIIISIDDALTLIPNLQIIFNELNITDHYNMQSIKQAWNQVPKEDKKIKITYIPDFEESTISNPTEVEIIGVTPFERFFSDDLFDKLTSLESNFVDDSFIDFNNYYNGIGPDEHNLFFSYNPYRFLKQSGSADYQIYWGQGKTARPLQENEIIVPSDIFWNRNSGQVQPSETESKMFFDNLSNNNAVFGKMIWSENIQVVHGDKKLKIVGICFNSTETIVSDTFFNYLSDFKSRPQSVVVRLSNNANQNKKLYDYIESYNKNDGLIYEKLSVTSHITDFMDMIEYMIITLKTILFYASLAFCLFSALLFMNFIGVSVMNKKKEIGVLRAIGARGNDVFKIFFAEGLIIGAINFILAAIALAVTTAIVNATVGIAILVFNILPYLLMAGLSLLVVIFATYIPVRKLASKKPIDAINNR